MVRKESLCKVFGSPAKRVKVAIATKMCPVCLDWLRQLA